MDQYTAAKMLQVMLILASSLVLTSVLQTWERNYRWYDAYQKDDNLSEFE